MKDIFNKFMRRINGANRQKSDQEIDFKFTDEPNKPVYTCRHIVDDKALVQMAVHDDDGDWQFLCGQDTHSMEESCIVSLVQMVRLDNSLNALFDMPKGHSAFRSKKSNKWSRQVE